MRCQRVILCYVWFLVSSTSGFGQSGADDIPGDSAAPANALTPSNRSFQDGSAREFEMLQETLPKLHDRPVDFGSIVPKGPQLAIEIQLHLAEAQRYLRAAGLSAEADQIQQLRQQIGRKQSPQQLLINQMEARVKELQSEIARLKQSQQVVVEPELTRRRVLTVPYSEHGSKSTNQRVDNGSHAIATGQPRVADEIARALQGQVRG